MFKQSGADPIQTLMSVERQVWLFGTKMSEDWYNSGAADFTFSPLPGDIEHGIAAKYSVAKQDVIVFFLEQDRQQNRECQRDDRFAEDVEDVYRRNERYERAGELQ